jgi:sulfur transfer protein SufE
VQGFVSLLIEVLSGAPAAEALAVGPALVNRLGLSAALGMVRTRGLSAILFAVRKRIELALSAPSS